MNSILFDNQLQFTHIVGVHKNKLVPEQGVHLIDVAWQCPEAIVHCSEGDARVVTLDGGHHHVGGVLRRSVYMAIGEKEGICKRSRKFGIEWMRHDGELIGYSDDKDELEVAVG